MNVKIIGWLRQVVKCRLSEGLTIWVADGDTVLNLVRRLTQEDPAVLRGIVGDQCEEIGATVLVALNGCLVNPHDVTETALRDGDEVTFLPAFEGG